MFLAKSVYKTGILWYHAFWNIIFDGSKEKTYGFREEKENSEGEL